jgi:hypothetical protein
VFVVRFNYLRHVMFSAGYLYPCFVDVLTWQFKCCACSIMYWTTSVIFNSITLECLISSIILKYILWPQWMKQQHTSLLEYAINNNIVNSRVHENTLKQDQVHYMRTQWNNSITWQHRDYCKTTGCNEATSSSSMHSDSPLLLSHGKLALASAPSPPYAQ